MTVSRRVVWGVALLLVVSAAYLTVRHRRDLVDFNVFRTAGVRAGAAQPLYRPEDGHYQFKYLPAFALAMAPVAALAPETGKAIWFTASAVLLVVFVSWSVAALPNRRRSRALLTWLTVLFMGKFYVHELALGQSNILLGLLLLAALLASERRHPFAGAALVGVAVFIKPYAIILVPWMAAVDGLATLLVFGAVVAAGLVAPAAAYGWTGNLDLLAAWYRTVTDTTAPNLLLPENISLGTMWAKWIGPGSAAARLAIASAAGLLGLGVWVVAVRARVPRPRYLEFGFLMLLVPLISPQGWDYVLLLATPAIVCLLDRWGDLRAGWRMVTGLSLVLTSFTIFDLLGRALYGWLMGLSIVTVAACGLAAALVHLRRQSLA